MKRDLIKPSIELKKSSIAGYGVYASKSFKKGEIIEECPVLFINKPSTTPYYNYVFSSSDTENFFLPLGYGCLYNHAGLPNATWDYDEHNKLLIFSALKNLHKGEEIFIYYAPTWFSARGINPKAPATLPEKIFLFSGRIALLLLFFFILKMALFPQKHSPHPSNPPINQTTKVS